MRSGWASIHVGDCSHAPWKRGLGDGGKQMSFCDSATSCKSRPMVRDTVKTSWCKVPSARIVWSPDFLVPKSNKLFTSLIWTNTTLSLPFKNCVTLRIFRFGRQHSGWKSHSQNPYCWTAARPIRLIYLIQKWSSMMKLWLRSIASSSHQDPEINDIYIYIIYTMKYDEIYWNEIQTKRHLYELPCPTQGRQGPVATCLATRRFCEAGHICPNLWMISHLTLGCEHTASPEAPRLNSSCLVLHDSIHKEPQSLKICLTAARVQDGRQEMALTPAKYIFYRLNTAVAQWDLFAQVFFSDGFILSCIGERSAKLIWNLHCPSPQKGR